MNNHSKFLVAALAAAFTMGCNTVAEPPPPQLPAPPKRAPATTKQAPPEVHEHSQLAASAPFVLTLETPAGEHEKGETVKVVARIEAQKGWTVATAIDISLPKGAKLVEGQKREVLVALPQGVTTRSFKITLGSRLTEASPIKVTVAMKDSKGAFGAHAVRSFPEAKKKTTKASSRVPAPPMGRPKKGIGARSFDPSPRTAPGTRQKSP